MNVFKFKRAPVQSTLDGSSKRFHGKLSWQGSVVGCRQTDPSVAKHRTKRKRGASRGAPLGPGDDESHRCIRAVGISRPAAQDGRTRRDTPLRGWEFSRTWCALTCMPKSTLRQAQGRLCGSAAEVRTTMIAGSFTPPLPKPGKGGHPVSSLVASA